MVDENEFFRQVTLKVCGYLEVEEGLKDCFEYLAQHIPADALYLEKYEPNLNAMRVIVRTNSRNSEQMDVLIHLPDKARTMMSEMKDLWVTGALPPVLVINKPEEEPVTKSMLKALDEPSSSAMSLPLIIEDQVVGALAVIAGGDNRYNEYHERLYATLKEPFAIAMSNALKHREVLKLKDMLIDDNRYLQRELMRFSGDDIVGADFGLKSVMEMVRKVAASDSPVLLLGETGTGKDVMANTIHYSSPRSEKPFITVNCGAIPDSLIDSELFGHEKGSFTGATSQKRGRFERADKGTIFLDEVGELPPQAQVRLLRVLQNKEFERVGGSQTIKVDVRVIAATNKNLEEMVKAGTFREDLWFRLNVFPITIPPLRARREDIPALAYHFLERKSKQLKITPTPELASGAIEKMMNYRWPGNVRELDNVIERAIILNPQGPLQFNNLEGVNQGELSVEETKSDATDFCDSLALDAIVSTHIRHVLEMTEGKIHGPDGAAKLLEMNPSTLRSKMKKLEISIRQ